MLSGRSSGPAQHGTRLDRRGARAGRAIARPGRRHRWSPPSAGTAQHVANGTPTPDWRGPGPTPTGPVISLPGVLVLCCVAFMAARPPWWSFNYAAILAVIAVLLSGRLPRLRLPDTLALGTALWAFATLFWTSRPDLTVNAAYRYASVCLLFVACRHVVRTKRDLLLLGYTFLAGCAVVAFEVVTGAREMLSAENQVLDFANRHGIEGTEVNFTAYTMTAGVVLGFVLFAATARRRWLRWCPLAVAVLLSYALLLTGSRGGAIGVLLGVAVLILGWGLPRLMAVTIAVLTPLLILVVPFGMVPESGLMWLDNLYGRPTGDISGRLPLWPFAVSTWSDAPITGSGAGVFVTVNPLEIGPHNLLLTLGNDLGLVGALLYFGTIAAALVATARTGRVGTLLACCYTVAMLPIWLTGQWEASLTAWLVLALVTLRSTGTGTARPPAPKPARHRLETNRALVPTRPG